MKKIVAFALIWFCVSASADQYVDGYVRQDGTYVAPHFRSEPNQYRFDNYSSQGNYNPYTGQQGYQRHEYSTPSIYSYPQAQPRRRSAWD